MNNGFMRAECTILNAARSQELFYTVDEGKVMQYGYKQDAKEKGEYANYFLGFGNAPNPYIAGDLLKCQAVKIVSSTFSGDNSTEFKVAVDMSTCVTAAADPRADM